MSNQNSMGGSNHRLAFGVPDAGNPNAIMQGVNKAANRAYFVPTSGGWLLYTRFHSCRARLCVTDGWTQEQVEVAARILDGEVIP